MIFLSLPGLETQAQVVSWAAPSAACLTPCGQNLPELPVVSLHACLFLSSLLVRSPFVAALFQAAPELCLCSEVQLRLQHKGCGIWLNPHTVMAVSQHRHCMHSL